MGEVTAGSGNKLDELEYKYKPQPKFVVLWVIDERYDDDYEDMPLIWGVFDSEVESKAAYEEALKLAEKSEKLKRGRFSWHRVESINRGPNEIDKLVRFRISN